jgi:hypothetical protein
MSTSGNTQRQVADATKRVTGKQYCSNHQGYTASEEGSMVVRGKISMFKCFNCQSKAKR